MRAIQSQCPLTLGLSLSDIKKDKTNQIDFLLIREVVKSRNYAVNSSKIITDAGCIAVCVTIVLPEKQAVNWRKINFSVSCSFKQNAFIQFQICCRNLKPQIMFNKKLLPFGLLIVYNLAVYQPIYQFSYKLRCFRINLLRNSIFLHSGLNPA